MYVYAGRAIHIHVNESRGDALVGQGSFLVFKFPCLQVSSQLCTRNMCRDTYTESRGRPSGELQGEELQVGEIGQCKRAGRGNCLGMFP